MTERFNEATVNRTEGDRKLDAPYVLIDLQEYKEQLTEEKAWKKNDRNAITVFKTAGISIVLVALHKEASMNPHSIDGVTSIHVLKGHLQINKSGENIDVEEKQILTLHPHVDHEITAKKKSVFLLTVTGNYKDIFENKV